MTRKSTRFERPYFVAPHAVGRFQERVAPIPARDIIHLVQQALQHPGPPVDVEPRGPVYQAAYRGRTYYIPVITGNGEWPTVPTILGDESVLHGRMVRIKRRMRRFEQRRP